MTRDDARKILILGAYPPPFGGIATHIRGLIPALEEAGYAVDVVSPGMTDGEEQISERSTVHRISKQTDANVRRIVRDPLGFLSHVAGTRILSREVAKSHVIASVARRVLRRHGSSVKLISAYSVHPWGLAGALLSEEFSIPLVTTNFGELFQFRDFFVRNRHVVERVVSRSAALLASSKHCGRMYETCLGMHGVEAQAIPYGVDPVFFGPAPSRDEVRRREKLPLDRAVALFVGRMNAEMGLDTWLAAVEALAPSPDLHFVILGASGPLTSVARRLEARWPDRVSVRVDVPFASLPDYYAASDVLVAPSADERACMGIAIKEAMAVSRAVVATDVGGIGEAVVPGVTGILVPALDPSVLAIAIRDLVTDRARLEEMGRNGRERAEQLFTMEGTHRRVLEVMERVMRASSGSASSS